MTVLARTAVDLACQVRRHESLSVLDAALRLGSSVAELGAEIVASTGNTGIVQARWALQHADARAESPAESISRYWMIVGCVPTPTLQFEVRDAGGQLLGRSDFAWEEYRVLGEFDGKFKYEPEAFDGRAVADVVFAEKRRENNLAFAGWTMIRWDDRDLRNGPAFASRLNRYLRSRSEPRAS